MLGQDRKCRQMHGDASSTFSVDHLPAGDGPFGGVAEDTDSLNAAGIDDPGSLPGASQIAST